MFNESEGRVKVTFDGAARPRATIEPRSIALVSYFSGECEIDSLVNFQARASFTIDLSGDLTRPVVDIGFVDLTGTVGFVEATGTVWAFHGPFPWPRDCDSIEGDIQDGLVEQVDEKLSTIEDDDGLKTQIQDELGKMLEAGDLADGPLASADLSLPNGVGFTLGSARYVPTAPPNHVGGDVDVTTEGIDLAAGVHVDDQGGQRFGYSYVPSSSWSLVGATSSRNRPAGSPWSSFDLGVVLSGATVNQLGRALTAGRPQTVAGQTREVGLLDMTTKVDIDGSGPSTLEVDVDVHPAVPVMFLPTPPTGWPIAGDVDLYVPSLRISIPHPELATMVADVRVGATASIDTATDHLVPSVQTSNVAARFLRLGPQINQVTDPVDAPGGLLAGAAARIQQAVPEKVAELLAPVAIPDLAVEGTALHLEHLTVAPVGGHLGAWVDVATGTPPPIMSTTWAPSGQLAPTSFTTSLQLPPSTGYKLNWTVTDLNGDQGVIYQSPAAGETATTKTFPTTGLDVVDQVCTGEHWVRVRVSVVVTRVSTTRTETQSSVRHWPGTPPAEPPPGCEPDPEPEPEPEDPPIPPICIRKPWLCEEEP